MWKGGLEAEWMTEVERMDTYLRGSDKAPNPMQRSMTMLTFGPKLTYGLGTDLSLYGGTPMVYMNESMTGHREQILTTGIFDIGMKYRVYNNPLPGGSEQLGVFFDIELPTAKPRMGLKRFQETTDITVGLTGAISNSRNYYWADLGLETGVTNRSGTGGGPMGSLHLAYARRMWDLENFDDPDLIILLEGDLAAQAKGTLNGVVDSNSGFAAAHLALGIQYNITNLYQCRVGYNLPVWRRYNGTQFVHDGEFKFTFSWLF
jgi:hypothetical protein